MLMILKVFLPILLLLAGLSASLCGAESTYPADDVLLKLNEEVQSLADRAVMDESPEPALDPGLVRGLFSYTPFKGSESDIQKEIVLKKLALVEKELGFKIAGYYQRDADDGILEDEGNSSRDGGYVGLEWDFLRDGLFENRKNRLIASNDIKIHSLLDAYLRKDEKIPYTYYYIIYCFNKAKIERLKERLAYIERYEDVSQMLYYFMYVPREDIITVRQEKAEVEAMLATYLQFNRDMAESGVEAINIERLPVLDVDLHGIIQAVKEDDTFKKVLALENEKRLAEQDTLSDIQLRAFARYYSSDTFSSDATDRTAFGLYFRIPLPLKSGYRDLALIENRRAEFRLSMQSEATLNQIRDTYYEYRYKLKDAITFQYKKQILKERLRRETTRRVFEDSSYNPIQTFHLVNQLHAVEFEYIDIRQQLYLKLLEIYRHCRENALVQNISAANIKTSERQYTGDRSVYVWSAQFNELGNQFLFTYLRNQEIGDVLMSMGDKVDKEKLKEFLAGAGKRRIKVQAVLGDNSLIYLQKRDKLSAKLEEAAGYGFDGIHLDIEPHVFDDWKEKKEAYLKDYMDALQFVRSKLPAGRTLSVSIPVFYPSEALREIFAVADKVYVMAYGTDDLEKLKRRLVEEVNTGRDKVVVAIRPGDFRNRYEMERYSTGAMDSLGVKGVAFHDLKGLLEMDETGIAGRNLRPGRQSK